MGWPDAEGVRLQKVLSQAGVASRRVAEKMILDGRVEDAKTVVGALACDAVARRLAPDVSTED